MDTYQLKSLDGLLDLDLNNVNILKIENKYYLSQRENSSSHLQINTRVGYDKVLRCLGFKFNYKIFKK